ncbi:MAG: DUF433 domain-containing protein [Anaerolineae bacterium]
MDQVIIPINYIERKPNSEKYRVVGKGVTVEFLSLFVDDPEWTVERICENYNLTPAEVYAAWSFYYDHKAEIDARVKAASTTTPEQEQQQHDLRTRLLERYRARTGHDDADL